MSKLGLSVAIVIMGVLLGIILGLGETPDLDIAYASDDLSQSPGNEPEVSQDGPNTTGNSSEERPDSGSDNEQEHPNIGTQKSNTGSPVRETGTPVRVKIMSLTVLNTHLDPYSTYWRVYVGVRDNSSNPVEQKVGVVKKMNWVPVQVNQVFELYPSQVSTNTNLTGSTYYDVYVPLVQNPGSQTREVNTGLLIYSGGDVSTNSDVLTLKDNKLGTISEFFTSATNYGLGEHTVTSTKGDYILKYRIDRPVNLANPQMGLK